MLPNKSEEEEEYIPHASGRIYDFDSDESLNRFEHENYCMPFQPPPNFCQYGSSERLFLMSPHLMQRRHSSYSHEDILHMKYREPPVDPRYRDNRPFASSNSSLYDNARRDFMSRRRSSSSLQDDLLRPFQTVQLNNYLRKSNPTITNNHNNSSPSISKCNSNWNLNPSIFIEEYNDNATEVKSNASSTNLSYTEFHQPLNEESVAPFAGCDAIPFIDDERPEPTTTTTTTQPIGHDNATTHYCDIYMPTVNCVEQQRRQQQQPSRPIPEKSLPSYIKNRKTVSFDLVGSDEELNAIRKSNLLNKSNTCDHITNIKLHDQHRRIVGTKPTPTPIPLIPPPPAPPALAVQQKRPTAAAINDSSEPIFKFCTLKHATNSKEPPTESFKTHTIVDNDSLSAYFNDDYNTTQDQLDFKKSHNNEPKSIIDTKSILLDLSELNSDTLSSTSSSHTEPEITSKIINPSYANQPSPNQSTHGVTKFAYIPAWNPPEFCDRIAYGNGKVRALKNYFENLKLAESRQFSESSPDLSKKSDKLTETERQMVLEQLKEWSEFGTSANEATSSQTQSHNNSSKAIQTNPLTHSVLNLTVTTSFNDNSCKDRLTVATRSNSEPDVNDYFITEDMILPQPKKKHNTRKDSVKPPGKSFCTNIKTTHKFTKSCPNLCRSTSNLEKPYYVSSKLRTSIYNSPCHRSHNVTVRKVKQQQRNGKRAKMCGKKNGNCPFAKSDATDNAR